MTKISVGLFLFFCSFCINNVWAETSNKNNTAPIQANLNKQSNDKKVYLDMKAINDGYQASLEAMFMHFVDSAENNKSAQEFFSKLWFLDIKDTKTQAVLEKNFKQMKTPKLQKVMNGFVVDMGDGQPLRIEAGHSLGELRINGELRDTFENPKKQSSSAAKSFPGAFVLLGIDSAFAGKLDLVLQPIKFLNTALDKSARVHDFLWPFSDTKPKEVILETLEGWTRFGAAGAVGGCIVGGHLEESDCKEGALVGGVAGVGVGAYITTSMTMFAGFDRVKTYMSNLNRVGKFDQIKKQIKNLPEVARKIGLIGLTLHGGNELATMNGMELVCEENGSFKIFDLKNGKRNDFPTYSVHVDNFWINGGDKNNDSFGSDYFHRLNDIGRLLKSRFPMKDGQDKNEYEKAINILAEGYRDEISGLKKICVDHGDNYTHKFVFDKVAETGKSSMEEKIYKKESVQPGTK